MQFLTRREFLHLIGLSIVTVILSGCKPNSNDSDEISLERTQEMTTAKKLRLYVGTYTKTYGSAATQSKGIYLYELDASNGSLTQVACAAETEQPSFLAFHPNHNVLYAAGELMNFKGQPGGAISAFSIDKETGLLSLLNQQPTLGGAPCYVSVDQTGRYALVANYMGGNAIIYPIQANGSLGDSSHTVQHQGKGPNTSRQEGPHVHSVTIDPTNQYVMVADLGIDKIMIYKFSEGQFFPNDPSWVDVTPGAGPRHMDFHPSGKFAYLINELNCTITAFNYESANGNLTEFQTVPTLPQDFQGENSCADIHIAPSGKFLYGSNRGHDSIVIYAIDDNGKLSYVGHESTQGETPRNFAIDPDGNFLLAANQDSSSIITYWIDGQTGKLTPTGNITQAPTPVCIKFL